MIEQCRGGQPGPVCYHAAATDGVSKAGISNITDRKDTATAVGTFMGFQSVAAMGASTLAGAIWYMFGAEAAFLATGIATLAVIAYFLLLVPWGGEG